MKKYFLIIFIFVLGGAVTVAARPGTLREKAQKEIFKALQKYGTNIRDKGDGEMTFRYEDLTYEVNVKELNPEILYFALVVEFNMPDDYIDYVATVAANIVASDKPICAFAGSGSLVFSCEMYAKNAKPFIDVLPEMLFALNYCAINIQDEYLKQEEMYKAYLERKAGESSVSDTIGEIVDKDVDFQKFSIASKHISTPYHIWECEGIELYPTRTVLQKKVYPKRAGTYVNSAANEYIEDAQTGQRYYIIDSSIGMEGGERRESYDMNPIEFIEIYPVLPKSVKMINIYSGSDYYIKNLQIR